MGLRREIDTVTDDFKRDELGVLRGSTGAPVNDGSPAFKAEVMSRIEKADKRIGLISSKDFLTEVRKFRKEKYGF